MVHLHVVLFVMALKHADFFFKVIIFLWKSKEKHNKIILPNEDNNNYFQK